MSLLSAHLRLLFSRRRILLVAVISAILQEYAVSEEAFLTQSPCCEISGSVQVLDVNDNETCECFSLRDDIPARVYAQEPGTQKFHWKLKNYTQMSLSDEERPPFHVRVDPCVGDPELYVHPYSFVSPSNMSVWSANAHPTFSSFVEVSLEYMNYYVHIDSRRPNVTYEIAAILDISKYANPASDAVTSKQTRPDTIEVFWNTTENADAVYQVFYTEKNKCSAKGENTSQPHQCIMHTPCGMEMGGISASAGAYEAYPPSSRVSKSIQSLRLDVEYYFNVVVQSPDGLKIAYAGTLGTPTFERIVAAASETAILLISVVLGAAFAILIGFALFTGHRARDSYKISKRRGDDGEEGKCASSAKGSSANARERKRYWNRLVRERRRGGGKTTNKKK